MGNALLGWNAISTETWLKNAVGDLLECSCRIALYAWSVVTWNAHNRIAALCSTVVTCTEVGGLDVCGCEASASQWLGWMYAAVKSSKFLTGMR